jgi:hypothetical protein
MILLHIEAIYGSMGSMKRVFGTLLACGFLCAAMASAEPVATHPKPDHKAVHDKFKKAKVKKNAKGRKVVVKKVAPKKVAG